MMRGERKLKLERKFSQNSSRVAGAKDSMRLLISKDTRSCEL